MPPLAMHRHRGAVEQPQALMREVIRVKVNQIKAASALQLQLRESLFFKPPLAITGIHNRIFRSRTSLAEERGTFAGCKMGAFCLDLHPDQMAKVRNHVKGLAPGMW